MPDLRVNGLNISTIAIERPAMMYEQISMAYDHESYLEIRSGPTPHLVLDVQGKPICMLVDVNELPHISMHTRIDPPWGETVAGEIAGAKGQKAQFLANLLASAMVAYERYPSPRGKRYTPERYCASVNRCAPLHRDADKQSPVFLFSFHGGSPGYIVFPRYSMLARLGHGDLLVFNAANHHATWTAAGPQAGGKSADGWRCNVALYSDQ